jgi:hypothetical protein
MNTRGRNNALGQGIVEGTVGLMLVVAGIVLGTLLLMCTGFAVNYKTKLAVVAQETSGYVQGRQMWIGTLRPDYNPTKIREEAKDVANELLKRFGMPPFSKIQFKETTTGENRFCEVSLTVDKLRIPGGGILPSFISLTETGVSINNSETCWGYAQLRINGANSNAGIVVPCIGFALRNQPFAMGQSLGCRPLGPSLHGSYMLQGEPQGPIVRITPRGEEVYAY